MKPGQISAKRAYELSDSLYNANKKLNSFKDQKVIQSNREKAGRLKDRANEAMKKAGGKLYGTSPSATYDSRAYEISSVNKAVGRDMPLPPSSQLFDA